MKEKKKHEEKVRAEQKKGETTAKDVKEMKVKKSQKAEEMKPIPRQLP
jgi:hypothetical protein